MHYWLRNLWVVFTFYASIHATVENLSTQGCNLHYGKSGRWCRRSCNFGL